jgi:hypothetical protein
MVIKLSKHAKIKIYQRNISLDDIKKVVQTPMTTKPDKFDKSLMHFIGPIKGRFLRIIGRRENKEELLIISAFILTPIRRGQILEVEYGKLGRVTRRCP